MTIIATAGHVDHGKSSLVRAMTGVDPDRLEEEKKRGMTIDLGFAHCTTPSGAHFSFIDVPGHVDFIRNMISGVSSVDIVLFAVDGQEGWMPQTDEHCDILSLLGLQDVVVAITKCDRASADAITTLEHDIRQRLLARGMSVHAVVPTSVITQQGIAEVVSSLETLVTSHRHETRNAQRMRMYVDRVFTMTGSGTVVTGTLQGTVAEHDSLVLVRDCSEIRVRNIQAHGDNVTRLTGPARCALNLAGVSVNDIQRGDVLTVQGEWNPTTRCVVKLNVLPSLQHGVSKRGQFILHVGSSDQQVRLRILQQDEIAPGHSGVVQLSFEVPLPLLPHDRFVIRETGRSETIGGGIVLDAHPLSPVSGAISDGTLETYLRARGWMRVDDVKRDTGFECVPVVSEWIAHSELVAQTKMELDQLLEVSPSGIDMTHLDPWQSALLQQMDDVNITLGVARRGEQFTPDEDRICIMIRDAGVRGPDATALPRHVMKRLVQMGLVYEHDGLAFHVDTIESLRPTLEQLWMTHPDGFPMSALRDAVGITRKHAVPLGNVLDKHGLTKRISDVRVRGARW
jgi:selenocysteine-specific elongation factor